MKSFKNKPDLKRIYKELHTLGPHVVKDLVVDVVTPYHTALFKKCLPPWIPPDHEAQSFQIAMTVDNPKETYWRQAFEILIDLNTKYIKRTNYISYDHDKLIKEFEGSHSPALNSGRGITPEMLYLYYLSEGLFNHPELPFLKEQYTIADQMVMSAPPHDESFVPIKLREELAEIESDLNQWVEDRTITYRSKDEKDLFDFAQKYHSSYDPDTKTFNNVPRGLIAYFEEYLLKTKEVVTKAASFYIDTRRYARRINTITPQITKELELADKQAEELNALKRRNKTLLRENDELRRQPQSVVKADSAATVTRLERENNYLRTRIEDLEARISTLEEETRENEAIADDIALPEPDRAKASAQIEVVPGARIVISGGYWTSDRRSEVEAWADPQHLRVLFVPADETLRRFDTITNSDHIIIDTSRHSHKYTYKLRDCGVPTSFISKSSPAGIRGLFA